MALRDLYHKTKAILSLAPAARVTGTATGSAVDLRGYDAAMIVVTFGVWTDGTHTPSVQHSIDGMSYADCAASDLDGSLTAVSSSAGNNTVQQAGYIGSRRYVRVVMTTSGASTGALSSAGVIAGEPRNAPVQ